MILNSIRCRMLGAGEKKKKSSTKKEIKDPFSEAEITYDLTVC